MRLRTRRPLLRVESLEDRRTPAINVAVVGAPSGGDNSGFQAIVDQLNDNTGSFGFNAALVDSSQLHSEAALDAYNAVVIGNNGSYPNGDAFADPAFASALHTWVSDGGGVVMTGWGIYGSSNTTQNPDIDAVIPVNTSAASGFYTNATLQPSPGAQGPITAGVPAFHVSLSDYIEYPLGGVDPGATVLATVNGQPAVVEGTVGLGKGVYLGPIYSGFSGYNNGELRTGPAHQLL